MKTIRTLLVLAVAALSSISLSAQDYQRVITRDGSNYEGQWPKGAGVLYSYNDGLVLGTFVKGKPHGKCVCYRPNGEVYWGEFKKGKATGNGRIYRDNGIVISGGYKNGKYHGVDTLYRSNGTVHVGKYKHGKMKETVLDTRNPGAAAVGAKPAYPGIDFRYRQITFLNDLENMWEERNLAIVRSLGLVHPKFQGAGVDDFALWVNSQVVYPEGDRADRSERTVIVEFVVLKDGTVSDAHAVFGSDPVLNEAAVAAVMKSPKWTPGEQNGEPRNVRMSVPVVFDL
jgi:TonB family protein